MYVSIEKIIGDSEKKLLGRTVIVPMAAGFAAGIVSHRRSSAFLVSWR